MRVRRGDLRDVYVEDDRAAVFVNDQVIVLSEIATTILNAVPTGRAASLLEITEAVLAEHGTPDRPLDARDLTRGHVLDLVAHRVLWDDHAPADETFTPQSIAALRDALRHVLSPQSLKWQYPDEVPGPQFVAAAMRHRVVPSVAGSLARLSLPRPTAARLSAQTAQEVATVQRLSAELAGLVEALELSGVRALAFKGLSLAVQAHGSVAARGTGDHDLLVPPSDVERAHQVLTGKGWVPAGSFPQPGHSWAWRRLVRDYYELPLVGAASTIDLHWRLSPVRNAFPSFDVLWSRRSTVSVGGRSIPTLSPYDALAHSATHSAKDHWRWLRGLLDVWLLMADPFTWQTADRPLRHDQLLSVGLAARMFGTPPGAPRVVYEARELAAEAWDTAVNRQAGPSQVDPIARVPGAGLYRALVALHRAGAAGSDVRRQILLSLIPPTCGADLPTSSAWVAVPQVLGRRSLEISRLWADALVRQFRATAPPALGSHDRPA